jgi:MFS family permease
MSSSVALRERSPGPWYAGLSADAWRALVASNLGWIFDGYETFALVLTANVALNQLLPAAQRPHALYYQGLVVAMTLLGWACGGILWGVLADYVGRRPAMMQSILIYSVFTGLTFFAGTWWWLAILRFLTGLGLGAEWGTGVSLVAEKWPDRARAKGASILQSGIGFGFFLASFVWYLLQGAGPNAWRYMYLLGVLPALVLLYLRSRVSESERWSHVSERRAEVRRRGARSEEDRALARFTLAGLFETPQRRRDTWVALLMSLATNVAWWGVATWVPVYVATTMHARYGAPPLVWGSYAGIVYNGADILGLMAFAFIADAIGRKPTLVVYYALSVVLVPLLFLGGHTPGWLLTLAALNGFFTAGQYSWFSVWVPELYPTRVRATAASFIFNVSRFVAFLGPIFAGALIVRLHGLANAATAVGLIFVVGLVASFFARETRGQPLPD